MNRLLTVIGWNIEAGGEVPKGDFTRYHAAVDMAREHFSGDDPQIICVQEATRWKDNDGARLWEFAAATRTWPLVAPRKSGYDLPIFVSRDIEVQAFRPNPPHLLCDAGLATLRIPGWDEPVTILNTHFSPWDGEIRRKEASAFVSFLHHKYFATVGDFNCIGPDDPEPDFRFLPAAKRDQHILHGTDGFDRRATQTLARSFRDAATLRNQQHLITAGGWLKKHPMALRPDHHWLSDAMAAQLVDYEVLDDMEWRALSDHLPVRTTYTTPQP